METQGQDPLVLLVDDDEELRKQAREMGFLTASNIQSCMNIIKQHSRDYFVVFLDWDLELAETGLDLLRRIQEEASDRVIAYLWTGKELTQEVRDEAGRAGAHGAFSKDISTCNDRGGIKNGYTMDGLLVYTTWKDSVAVRNLMASTADFLTGLSNPRNFRNRAVKELARAREEAKKPGDKRRHPDVFTLLFLDMDHFKDVNTYCGHPEGTRGIQRVADTLDKNIRDLDLACRWGGDEFGIWLPGAADPEIEISNLKQAVSGVSVTDLTGKPWALSVTIGAATRRREQIGDPEQTYEAMLQEADDANTAAKEARPEGLTKRTE